MNKPSNLKNIFMGQTWPVNYNAAKYKVYLERVDYVIEEPVDERIYKEYEALLDAYGNYKIALEAALLQEEPLQSTQGLEIEFPCYMTYEVKRFEKYFIPSILDLKEGYECEINSIRVNGKDEWTTYTIGEDYHNITLSRAKAELKHGGIRVPYLTMNRLGAEGWIQHGEHLRKGNILLDYRTRTLPMKLTVMTIDTNEKLATTTCRCINEFNAILDFLKIR